MAETPPSPETKWEKFLDSMGAYVPPQGKPDDLIDAYYKGAKESRDQAGLAIFAGVLILFVWWISRGRPPGAAFSLPHWFWLVSIPCFIFALFRARHSRDQSLTAINLQIEKEREEAAHKRQLEILEYQRITKPRWELDHDATQAVMQREHQRLLLLIRQPHELRLQAMSLPGSLLLIESQIRQEDKIGQFESLVNRTNVAVNRVMEDAMKGEKDEQKATKNASDAADLLMELIEAWARRQ